MKEKRVQLEDQNDQTMANGAVAFSLYLHAAEKTAGVYGLSFGDMVVLRHLHALKDEINLRQLGDIVMMLSGASITKIIDKLLHMGLVERRENPQSRREKLVKATPEGKRTFTRLIKDIHQLNAKALTGIPAAEKKRVHEGLLKVLENIVQLGEAV